MNLSGYLGEAEITIEAARYAIIEDRCPKNERQTGMEVIRKFKSRR